MFIPTYYQRWPLKEAFLRVYSKPEKWLYTHGILSSKNLCLPDFLGIGTGQSGSTWLFENLCSHPEVYISKKEIRYFEEIGFHRPLKDYSNMFESGSQKVKGDISPGYCIIPVEHIRFIRTTMPNVNVSST